MEKEEIAIFGAGLTGLTTAWKLSEKGNKVKIIELQNKIGGLSSSFKYKNFVLDYGPHKVYTQLPPILNEIKKLIGKDLLVIQKKSRIRLMKKYFDYPVKFKNLLIGINPLIGLKCGMDYFLSTLKNLIFKKKDMSYEDYIVKRFGKSTYNLLFGPYAQKVWGNPKKLSPNLAKTRIPIPSLLKMLKGMIFGEKKPEISAEQFYYPKKGIGDIPNKIARKIIAKKGEIHLQSYPVSMDIKDNKVKSITFMKKGKRKKINTSWVVSTIPIYQLPKLLKAPDEIISAANSLKYGPLILLYIIINKSSVFNDNWIFFPEKDFIFNRLSEQKKFSKYIIPKDKTVLIAEITNKQFWKYSDKEIFKRTITDLQKADLIKENEVEEFFTIKMKDVYPIYDLDYKENLSKILKYLDKIENLITNGRQGLFNYNNMDHCIDMGFLAAEHIIKNESIEGWKRKRKIFNNYKIVD